MEKEIGFVKEQNNKENHSHGLHVKLPAGIMTLAMLATLSPLHTARAEKPYYTPSHPIRQGGRLQPTTQEPQPTLVIPQKEQTQTTTQESTESYHIEETDPFSQKGMLGNFVAGYALMSEKEKEQIEQQVITDQFGATIFFSKRTFDRLNPTQSPLLGMRDQSFSPIALPTQSKENNPLESYVNKLEKLSELSLGEESFVAVDDDGGNQNIIVWNMVSSVFSRTQGKKHARGITLTSTEITSRVTDEYLLSKCDFYRNGELNDIYYESALEINQTSYARLAPFSTRPMWDDATNQLILADRIRIIAGYNLDHNNNQMKIKPVMREIPTLLGNLESRMRETIGMILQLAPEYFTDAYEVAQYVKTGEVKQLQYLKLLPDENHPYFFTVYGGAYGWKKNESLDIIQEALQFLGTLSPHILNQLNQFGTQIIGNFPYEKVSFPESILSDQSHDIKQYKKSIDLLKKLNNPNLTEKTIKESQRNITKSLQVQQYLVIREILKQSFLTYIARKISWKIYVEGENIKDKDINQIYNTSTAEFLKNFAEKYRDKLSNQMYINFIDEIKHLTQQTIK